MNTIDPDDILNTIANATSKIKPEHSASSLLDVALVAKLLHLPTAIADRHMPDEVGERLTSQLRIVRALPEVQKATRGLPLEIRWTPSMITDAGDSRPVMARAPSVVSAADRACWPGADPAPAWRLRVSLAWVLLATDAEIERALYEALAWCGVRDPDASTLVPCLVRPDVVAHGSALRRYGLGTRHQADALVGASAHPSTPARLAEWHIDASGQGALWAPREPQEAAPEPQRKRGASVRITAGSTGGSVTVTAEQAARAIKAIERAL